MGPSVDTGTAVATSRSTVLELRGISKRWGSAPPVLDRVDLNVVGGEVVSIAGRNGVGKTTLLRIVAGIIAPDEGEVRLGNSGGQESRGAYQRRIGWVGAGNTGLYARLTVDDHLLMWARLSLVPRCRRRTALDATVDLLALDELRGRRVDRLSMGQRQRLRLALGFLHSPDLLLLDEPHTSLDDEAMALLATAMDTHVQQGGSAILCSPSGWPSGVRLDRRLAIAAGKLEEE